MTGNGLRAQANYEAPSASRGRFVSPRWRSGSTSGARLRGVLGVWRNTPQNKERR